MKGTLENHSQRKKVNALPLARQPGRGRSGPPFSLLCHLPKAPCFSTSPFLSQEHPLPNSTLPLQVPHSCPDDPRPPGLQPARRR